MRAHAAVCLQLALVSTGLLLTTASCASPGPPGVTRTYYIAADPVDWDFAPTDTDLTFGMGRPLKQADFGLVGAKGQARVLRMAVIEPTRTRPSRR